MMKWMLNEEIYRVITNDVSDQINY